MNAGTLQQWRTADSLENIANKNTTQPMMRKLCGKWAESILCEAIAAAEAL